MGVKQDEQEQVATREGPLTAPSGVEEAGEPSEPASGAQGGAVSGRPGRSTVAERREAVLAVLSGKASVDQVARRYGVLPATVAGWRDQALGGIESVLARGDSQSPRERELEREVVRLRDLVASLSVEKAVAVKAIEEWKRQSHPSQPARSRR